MSDLREIYQEVILDHNKSPKNRRDLEEANCSADGYNPLCGDKVSVKALVDNGVIKDVAFEGIGCAISTASASLMTESIKGKTVEEAEALFHRFRAMVTDDESNAEGGDRVNLGKLTAFEGVCEFPVRIKCATLVWHTLQAALKNQTELVSTE